MKPPVHVVFVLNATKKFTEDCSLLMRVYKNAVSALRKDTPVPEIKTWTVPENGRVFYRIEMTVDTVEDIYWFARLQNFMYYLVEDHKMRYWMETSEDDFGIRCTPLSVEDELVYSNYLPYVDADHEDKPVNAIYFESKTGDYKDCVSAIRYLHRFEESFFPGMTHHAYTSLTVDNYIDIPIVKRFDTTIKYDIESFSSIAEFVDSLQTVLKDVAVNIKKNDDPPEDVMPSTYPHVLNAMTEEQVKALVLEGKEPNNE